MVFETVYQPDMYIPFGIEDKVAEALQEKRIVALIAPPGSGKTWLTKHVASSQGVDAYEYDLDLGKGGM